MTVSGSYDYTLTFANILTESLELLGILDLGKTVDSNHTTSCQRTFNLMMTHLQNKYVTPWNLIWLSQALTASTEKTGTDSNIYTAIRRHTSASGNQPITGSDYTTHWALKGSTGGSWTTAQSYTAIGNIVINNNVLDIVDAFIRQDGNDYQLKIISFQEYLNIVDKSDWSTPQYLALHRSYNTTSKLLETEIYLHPQPDDTTDVLHYLAFRRHDDVDSTSDNVEFTDRCLKALCWSFAADLAPKYKKDPTFYEQKAAILWKEAQGNDELKGKNDFIKSAF